MSDSFYKKMYFIREAENTLLELFSAGKLNGTVHTCVGQEANAVGVLSAIDTAKDIVVSNHRSHGHYLAYGAPLNRLFAEIMGMKEGVCRGIGGSQHIQFNNFYTNGVLGGTVSMAAGMAFAEKENDTQAVVVVFLGDGVFGEGIVYESFNMASLWQLPVLFVVEKNQYAQSTPIQQSIAGKFEDKLEAFGIKTIVNNTFLPEHIHKDAQDLITEVRQNGKPRCLIIESYRLAPHSKGDDFRDSDEMNEAQKKDVLNVWLSSLPVPLKNELDTEIQNHIQEALDFCSQCSVTEMGDLGW